MAGGGPLGAQVQSATSPTTLTVAAWRAPPALSGSLRHGFGLGPNLVRRRTTEIVCRTALSGSMSPCERRGSSDNRYEREAAFEGRAETLASEGFAALALAYFGLDQLPRELVRWQRYAWLLILNQNRCESLMSARTMDEVLEQLDEVIDLARREKSRLGYFAALYRNVTIKVNEGILAGSFEDGARMERFDVAFANRYLDALERYHRGEEPSKCWRTAFRAAQNWHPIVLQHLLLGINAHINLDLGIAAAQTSPGTQLAGLRRDFDSINNILWAMLDDVQDKLTLVSPLMSWLDSAGGRSDEVTMNFSIKRAREAAWRVAERLAPLSPEAMQKEIDVLDGWVDVLAAVIEHPPDTTVRLARFFVRLTEVRDVGKVIDVLARAQRPVGGQ